MRAIRGGPTVRAARGGLAGRRVQAMVIGLVVLVSTAASTLALGLLVDSNAPFDHAFAAQHGSHVTAAVNAAQVSSGQLAATTRLPGVTAAAGPFAETTANVLLQVPGGPGQPTGVAQIQLNVAGLRLARRSGRRPDADRGPLGPGSRGRSCSSATGSARR